MTSLEDNLTGRQNHVKNTSKEGIIGKLMVDMLICKAVGSVCLASQSEPWSSSALAHPQLVYKDITKRSPSLTHPPPTRTSLL